MSKILDTGGLISGHIDLILLKVISLEDGYGYSISKTITQMTENRCEVKEATLYSGLRRLENERLIASYWGDESQGGRRKYYTLTQAGRDSLVENEEKWELTKYLLDRILKTGGTSHDKSRAN
ncbi:MAG: PadR family transcriptional regulator [Defluviitaleaceae bacterium]|nr:PadR family transcriptional regulator [Defluviitaleaceae bacterium]MCL2275488.1 PadR family transcriptional regulator [Defluviitaleaceae bacterium]